MSGGGKFCSKVHKVHAVWESFIIVSGGGKLCSKFTKCMAHEELVYNEKM
jgi:hypothetical protein